MKKSIITLFILFLCGWGWAQIVTTNPQFVTQESGVTEITFDAASALGSMGLKDYTGDVYAHVGVITTASTSSSDWKYVLTPWPTAYNQSQANTTKNKLTSLGSNKWKLTISPTIRGYFNVPISETILRIALVFRNADGSKTGKTASGGDIFVDLVQPGLNVTFVNPPSDQAVTAGTVINIQVASSATANLNLLVNGTSVKNTPSSTSLTHSYTFSSAIDYTLIAEATSGPTTARDTVYVCVPAPVSNQARPAGAKDGINYIDNTTATLVLYAPGKTNVFLIGEFNNWRQLNAYQMKKDGNYWWYTLTGLTPGKIYGFQYLVDGNIRISDAYTEMVLDASNDKWINEKSIIYPDLKAYPDGKTEGLVATLQTAKPAYSWEVTSFTPPALDNMVIYELLLRDFTTEKSLAAAITKLDYLQTLGVTAIELMPIQEFDGNNSWGYNPNHFFASDKAYGSSAMYKKFIDECHKRGIAVILDVVFNHATGNHPFAKLYWNSSTSKPTADNPWFNVNAPHPYGVFNDFNHSFTGTKEYFKKVLQYWITEYKVDGFRLDLTKGFTQNSSTESTASNYDQSRIDNLSAYYDAAKAVKSNVMFILEHFCNNDEETALANKGMYLWRNSNNAYSQAAMAFSSESDFSGMSTLPRRWIGYAESHDEERNFYKAKMFGSGNLQSDSIARIKRVPLIMAFSTLVPGPKMIWQFGELGYDYSINSNGGRTNEKPSAWGWLNLAHRKAAYDATAKIITLRKLYPTAFTLGYLDLNVSTSDWSAGRRIALTHNDLNMIVLGNFDASTTITAYPNFQKTGIWYNLLTGQSLNVTNTSMTMTMQPGELLIYTDRKINLPTGLSEVQNKSEVSVFPTVTTGKVTISTSEMLKEARVFNLQGALINSISNSTEVDMSNFPNGFYLIKVTTDQGSSVYKVIKE